MRLVSWNIRQLALWDQLAVHGAELALLQEAPKPPCSAAPASPGWPEEILPEAGETWATGEHSPWRTAIARLSTSFTLKPIPSGGIEADSSTLRVSRPGTLTAATVVVGGKELFTAISVYAQWERPLGALKPIWADGSAHRLLSDVSLLISHHGLPLIVSGDWNILRGYGEHGATYNKGRYQTVFDRAEALGLRFVGPEYPQGRQADPWPPELPTDSKCVPTYHHGGQTPETATRQLDFVFASESLASRVQATAVNDPGDWGPSDHCPVLIDIDV